MLILILIMNNIKSIYNFSNIKDYILTSQITNILTTTYILLKKKKKTFFLYIVNYSEFRNLSNDLFFLFFFKKICLIIFIFIILNK